MTDDSEDTVPSLALHLMAQSADFTASIQRRVSDAYEHEAKLQAIRIRLIRADIEELCGHDWTPSTAATLSALYPSDADIDRFYAEHADGWV